MRLSIISTVALSVLLISSARADLMFPGKSPGSAQALNHDEVWTLRNDVISASWSFRDGQLRPAEFANRLEGKSLPQTGRELFRFALVTGEPLPQADSQTWLGIAWTDRNLNVRTSVNGQGWRTIATFPSSDFPGAPTLLRLGKMDKRGDLSDYPDVGASGTPRFDHLKVLGESAELFADEFDSSSPDSSWKMRLSNKPGAEISIKEGWLAITSAANCANFLEHPLSAEARQVTCRIDAASDQGQSWGPGLALAWPDGKSLVVNLRKEGTCSVIVNGTEQVIGNPFQDVPDYNRIASRFKVFAGPELVDLAAEPENPRAGSHHPGKAIVVKLRDPDSGLNVMWRAVLRDGSSYVREELTLMTSGKPVTLTGIQLLDRQVPSAVKAGTVPGSPVVADNFYFGAEIPVFSTEIDSAGFTSGFPCNYLLEPNQLVGFSSVVGVVPQGQLRRGFQYYLERERARPAKAYLHYNGWYDAAVSEKRFLEVIAAYRHKLIEKRGVKLGGFVIDDGWDDPQSTFWGWKRSALPNGLDKLRAAAVAAKSHLGIWISPLGGYGEAPQRIANARKQGLTNYDSLDLSNPNYYQWFKAKCLTLMHEDGINYFKWDKAGDGVNPHFMSLLKIADELHADDPNLFINVTVGTWPSPFWLNHVDSTWHGGGDVAWLGKGDKREQWLTYRDESARSVVKRGPLYPLNSLMLHGMVLGHAYQGKTVAEAGNHLRNECRSFFGSGTCMQEIYLSPDLMDDAAWDALAESAKWSQRNSDVLVDTHMIGGEPASLEPYGWAAWMPGKATLTLRNPDDKPRSITLDAQSVFELPDGAPHELSLKAGYQDQRVNSLDLSAGNPVTVELQPFEVLVFDTGA